MVTSATYQHELLFNTPEKLDLLQNKIFDLAEQFNWQLEAWAVFANHYHFLAHSNRLETLREMIKDFMEVPLMQLTNWIIRMDVKFDTNTGILKSL